MAESNYSKKEVERPIKRFIRLLNVDRRDIFYVFMYSVFAGIINLSMPLGIQAIINLIAIGQTSTSWIVLTIIIALATAFAGAMKLMQFNITELLQQRIFVRSAFEFAHRLPRLKVEDIKDNYAPELANRFFDTLSIQKGLPKIITEMSEALLQIFFGLILVTLYHPFFGLFSALIVFLLFLVVRISGGKGLKSSLTESKYKYKVAYWLEELGRMMNSFKLVGYTNYPIEKTDKLVNGYLEYRRKHFSILRIQVISIIIIKTLATVSLLLIGGWLVINQEINIGQFVAAELVIIMLIGSLEKIVSSMEIIFDVLTSVEKIGAVTDLPLESEEGMHFDEISKPGEPIAIRLQHVNYSVPNRDLPILEDINFEAKAGEKVAIVGWNNSGKSTLIKMIAGLLSNYTGTICYNDIPSKSINIASLRTYMGDYFTEQALFYATLEKNISMGRESVTTQEIIDVANKVGLLPYIQQLPLGLNTIIPSDGAGIPQSVIKRIILARCIVDTPKLVATESLLASTTDSEKNDLIDILLQGSWTLLSTTHHAALARRCDKVIVMKEGKVEFIGTFPELEQMPYCGDLFEDY